MNRPDNIRELRAEMNKSDEDAERVAAKFF